MNDLRCRKVHALIWLGATKLPDSRRNFLSRRSFHTHEEQSWSGRNVTR